MSRNPIMPSPSLSLLPQPQRPHCRTCRGWRQSDNAATDSRRLHSGRHQAAGEFFGWDSLPPSPKVVFDFWIANDDSRCPATDVKVTWG